jgi:dTDP-4-amino-4,6-dideoxygalactose transaminase
MTIPVTRPSPPRLSEAALQLRQIENRGMFSNFGPVNTAFEADLIAQLFNGKGACTTVSNATLGLMLAIRAVTLNQPQGGKRYALMPSFTFAATAHAAMWCGLTPLFCDIDPEIWAADPAAEEAMLAQHGNDIAVIVPYATFGYDIDLQHYTRLSEKYGVPVVVDAAASLGTMTANRENFGTGFAMPIVFSMHATKSFATAEGGLVYSTDAALIKQLRQMSNFGFGEQRTAAMPGLNAKMSEVSALQGRLRLQGYDQIVERRQSIVNLYRSLLPELTFQPARPARQAHQYTPALLPASLAPSRHLIEQNLARDGIGMATYFSPHLAQQEYFRNASPAAALPVTDDIASRIISLPLSDTLQPADVIQVAESLLKFISPNVTKRKIPSPVNRNIKAEPGMRHAGIG